VKLTHAWASKHQAPTYPRAHRALTLHRVVRSRASRARANGPMRPKCILIVDDEPTVLKALSRRFRTERAGWEVVCAAGGDAALELLESRKVHAVMTDMRMPGMQGEALLEQVQLLQPRALRIVLSGQLDDANSAATVRSAHHYLSKPCDFGVVLDLLDKWRSDSSSPPAGP
jgi:DNA-binding NtrC family response regulator